MTTYEPDNLLELLHGAARKHGARPSMIVEGVPRSYDWLQERAATLAWKLAELAEHGERCAVLGRRSELSYVALLAILTAGQVYVPLSPHDPVSRQAEKLAQSEVHCLIVDRASLEQLATILPQLQSVPAILAADSSRAEVEAAGLPPQTLCAEDFTASREFSALAPMRETDPAYLLFTSGSTGKPKGVLVPRSALYDYVVHMRALLGTHEEDRFSQGFDPAFDLGIHDILVCWASGAALIPLSDFKLRYLDQVRQHGITVWFSIPSSIALAEKTAQLKPGSMPSLRLSLFCGEALMAQDARAWERAASNSRILNLYGPTEATIAVSTHDATGSSDAEAVVPIGMPFEGNSFHLLDPETGIPAAGDEGELAIGGTQLATGYWRNTDLTAERFPTVEVDGQAVRVYRTGDRARREGGMYRFMGRLDNEVKIHGYRIHPLEVEATLARIADPALAVVVARSPGRLSPIDLVGFVSPGELSADEILKRCRAVLPNYMWPAQIHQTVEFPRLPNGKIDRRELSARAAQI